MTVAAVPAKPRRSQRPINYKPHTRLALIVGLVAAAVIAWIILRGPNLALLFAASPLVQIHVYAALAAFALGAALLLARKGDRMHRTAGWVWVALMATVAVVSLFITGINGDWWSWIHIFSGTTLLMLPLAVRAARKRNISAHRATMIWLYVGGMLIAGGFTFIPGRLMHSVFIAG